jgi:Tol biopolymer transport system component
MTRFRAVLPVGLAVALAGCASGSGPSGDVPSGSAPSLAAPSSVASASAASSPTPGPGFAVQPGEPWIVYQAGGSDGEDSIFLIRPDGTGKHELVPDMLGSESSPEWSADSNRIAFSRGVPDGTSELWVIGADGSDRQRLYACTAPCNEVGYPDWSPDGTAIYFSESADVPAGEQGPQTFRIGRLTLADGQVEYVRTRDDGLEMWQARVSPDGRTIAYEAGNEALGAAIFTAPVAGGEEFQVTDWELMGAHPDWTPDGQIVFHQWDLAIFPELDRPANMYIVGASGDGLEPLTHFTEPGWRAAQTRVSPDGLGVLFTRVEGPGWGSRRMAYLAFGDPEPRWLPPEPTDGTHPALRPRS